MHIRTKNGRTFTGVDPMLAAVLEDLQLVEVVPVEKPAPLPVEVGWVAYFHPMSEKPVIQRTVGATTEWFDGRTDGQGHAEVVGTDAKGLPIVQLADRDLVHTDPAHRAGIGQRTILLAAPHVSAGINFK